MVLAKDRHIEEYNTIVSNGEFIFLQDSMKNWERSLFSTSTVEIIGYSHAS